MDLERCRTLLFVAEIGNLSTAAHQLDYTVSGISRMITAMEKEIGFPLFFRSHHGVTPTPECNLLLPSIRKFVFSGDHCLQTAAKIQNLDIGTITIGTAYNSYWEPLSKILSGFRSQYPNILVQIKTGYSTELMERLLRHEIDLCFVSKREGNYRWLPICEDPLVAWLPAHHPLTKEEGVPIQIFETEPYIDILPGIDSDNSRVFHQFQIQPNTQFTVTDSTAAYSMVEAGLGITMNNAMNAMHLQGNVTIKPVLPHITAEIGAAYQDDTAPAIKTFLKYLSAHITLF